MAFHQAVFSKSAVDEKGFLTDKAGILFVGRSNVGKSTLINRLCRQKNLMHTSQRPGKTRFINYVLIDERFYLIDAPGYGYAQKQFSFFNLLTAYFKHGAITTKGIVMCLDARRGLQNLDEELKKYVAIWSIPLIYVFTKGDKLTRQARLQLQRAYASTAATKAFIIGDKDEESLAQLRIEIMALLNS